MDSWRLIVDGPSGGARNMAVDRAILSAHESGSGPPTLRLYRWSLPTVSLGRFQDVGDVDLAYCREHGIGVCRRPTGGRGVLHDDELTYSVVAGVRDGLPRGVRGSYGVLCEALAEAYRELGIAAELTARPRGPRGSGACYLHATPADLSLGAAKLSGSAQVWSHDSCLQHGSFTITRDIGREAAVFRLDHDARTALAKTTRTIVDACESRPADGVLEAAVVAGFERVFRIRLEAGDLSSDEERATGEAVADLALSDH